MTKELHKNSLRKVDNPHQWMIDDARMELIQQIKAEVNKLPEKNKGLYKQFGNSLGFIDGLDMVKKILSDLEKECEEPTIQERPVKIDIRKELESIEFMGVNDARDTETIARHFYELGRQSKPRIVFSKEVFDQYDREQFINAYKPKVCEGLKEEISRYLREECSNDDEPSVSEIARHFAQWGAEHRGSSEIPKDLEEAAVEYSAIGYSPFDDPYEKNQQFECSKFAFIAGAKWQKEQMMKEAVQGEVVQDIQGVNRVKSFSKVPDWLHFGQKVKLIIVKED